MTGSVPVKVLLPALKVFREDSLPNSGRVPKKKLLLTFTLIKFDVIVDNATGSVPMNPLFPTSTCCNEATKISGGSVPVIRLLPTCR